MYLINVTKRATFDQHSKLLKRSSYLLKGNELGIFYLTCFNNWKKYWLELLSDIRNKKNYVPRSLEEEK